MSPGAINGRPMLCIALSKFFSFLRPFRGTPLTPGADGHVGESDSKPTGLETRISRSGDRLADVASAPPALKITALAKPSIGIK